MSESFRKIVQIVFELRALVWGCGISLSIYKNEKLTRTAQSEMYAWRSAGYIRKSLFIFGYLWNAIRAGIFSVGYSRVSLTMYNNI